MMSSIFVYSFILCILLATFVANVFSTSISFNVTVVYSYVGITGLIPGYPADPVFGETIFQISNSDTVLLETSVIDLYTNLTSSGNMVNVTIPQTCVTVDVDGYGFPCPYAISCIISTSAVSNSSITISEGEFYTQASGAWPQYSLLYAQEYDSSSDFNYATVVSVVIGGIPTAYPTLIPGTTRSPTLFPPTASPTSIGDGIAQFLSFTTTLLCSNLTNYPSNTQLTTLVLDSSDIQALNDSVNVIYSNYLAEEFIVSTYIDDESQLVNAINGTLINITTFIIQPIGGTILNKNLYSSLLNSWDIYTIVPYGDLDASTHLSSPAVCTTSFQSQYVTTLPSSTTKNNSKNTKLKDNEVKLVASVSIIVILICIAAFVWAYRKWKIVNKTERRYDNGSINSSLVDSNTPFNHRI